MLMVFGDQSNSLKQDITPYQVNLPSVERQ